MAIITSSDGTRFADVDDGINAQKVSLIGRGFGYGLSATSGTIAAALGANSSVFVARLDPSSPRNAFIDRIRLKFTTVVAFTTPVTAGRRLELYRGSGAAASGGTSIASPPAKKGNADSSEMAVANGGDIRIATTGALTVTGITFETTPLKGVILSHVGSAGGFYDCLWEFNATESQPIQLEPGQLIAIRNPAAMDAAGTWQLQVDIDWYEAASQDFVL